LTIIANKHILKLSILLVICKTEEKYEDG